MTSRVNLDLIRKATLSLLGPSEPAPQPAPAKPEIDVSAPTEPQPAKVPYKQEPTSGVPSQHPDRDVHPASQDTRAEAPRLSPSGSPSSLGKRRGEASSQERNLKMQRKEGSDAIFFLHLGETQASKILSVPVARLPSDTFVFDGVTGVDDGPCCGFIVGSGISPLEGYMACIACGTCPVFRNVKGGKAYLVGPDDVPALGAAFERDLDEVAEGNFVVTVGEKRNEYELPILADFEDLYYEKCVEAESLARLLSSERSENAVLKRDVTLRGDVNKKITEQFAVASREKAGALEEKESLTKHVESLKRDLALASSELKKTTEELKTLRADHEKVVASSEKRKKSMTTAQKRARDAEAERDRIKSDLEEFRSTAHEQTSYVSKLTEEINRLGSEVETYRAKADSSTAELASLKAQVKDKQRELANILSEKNVLEEMSKKLMAKEANDGVQREDMERRVEAYESEKHLKQRELDEAKQELDFLRQVEKRADTLEQKLSDVTRALEKAEKKLAVEKKRGELCAEHRASVEQVLNEHPNGESAKGLLCPASVAVL